MILLAFLVHWRRALEGWRLGRATHELCGAGLIAPVWVVRRPSKEMHAKFFNRNLVAIRAEERLARVAGRPMLTSNEARATLNLPPRIND